MLTALIRLARPKHWIKNVFVLLPVPFAMKVGAKFEAAPFLLGLLGFCLINSAIYTLNDLRDAEADRRHPQKRHRPIASGVVPGWIAVVQIGVLLTLGWGLCLTFVQYKVVLVVAGYIAVNLAYCYGAKHIALLDVFLLAAGFVIRVLLGCVLMSVPPSAWLLLCTSSLALFLGFAKRRADIHEGLDRTHRPSLEGYNQAFLDAALSICAGVALLAYALYCIEMLKPMHPGREMASMPFVAYGILNYLRMVHVDGAGGSPVEIAYRSIPTQICGLGWLIAVTWSMGIWG
jgi:4-hydroxybenzoate polyprenyltransferase